LKAVAIAEDVILVFRLDSFELAIREAGGLGAHEVFHDINWYSKNYH
jgi:hypothetical protein